MIDCLPDPVNLHRLPHPASEISTFPQYAVTHLAEMTERPTDATLPRLRSFVSSAKSTISLRGSISFASPPGTCLTLSLPPSAVLFIYLCDELLLLYS